MKIKLDIKPEYKEIEVHICYKIENQEVKGLYASLRTILDDKLMAYHEDEKKMILCSNIIRVFSQNKNVYVTTKEGVYRLRERLYELEEKLDQSQFIRISNSEIVNIRKMERLDTSVTGTIHLYLNGGIDTYVSRRYVRTIKEKLGI